jgi:hypothetical protein
MVFLNWPRMRSVVGWPVGWVRAIFTTVGAACAWAAGSRRLRAATEQSMALNSFIEILQTVCENGFPTLRT